MSWIMQHLFDDDNDDTDNVDSTFIISPYIDVILIIVVVIYEHRENATINLVIAYYIGKYVVSILHYYVLNHHDLTFLEHVLRTRAMQTFALILLGAGFVLVCVQKCFHTDWVLLSTFGTIIILLAGGCFDSSVYFIYL